MTPKPLCDAMAALAEARVYARWIGDRLKGENTQTVADLATEAIDAAFDHLLEFATCDIDKAEEEGREHAENTIETKFKKEN